MKFTKKQKEAIKTLLDVIQLGVEWYSWEENDLAYRAGGCETIAHIVACFMVSKFGAKECDTSIARDVLALEGMTEFDRPSVRKSIYQLIKLSNGSK